MERRIIGEKPVTYSEVREILAKLMEERSRERGEGDGAEEDRGLAIIGEVLEYLSKVAPPLSAEKSRELVEKLVENGVKEVVAVAIANICPKSQGELMAILQMDRSISVVDVASKVYGIVREYCGE